MLSHDLSPAIQESFPIHCLLGPMCSGFRISQVEGVPMSSLMVWLPYPTPAGTLLLGAGCCREHGHTGHQAELRGPQLPAGTEWAGCVWHGPAQPLGVWEGAAEAPEGRTQGEYNRRGPVGEFSGALEGWVDGCLVVDLN